MASHGVAPDRPRPGAPGLPAPNTFSRNLPQFFFRKGQSEMAHERTLSIVKPDGVSRNLIGQVYSRLEKANLSIIAARMLHLSQREAEGFYAVHRERPFFKDLVKYMTSGPVVVQVLEGENAIARYREIMGATDPKKAAAGTIRADLALSIEQNVVHGSDSPENAATEIAYFFRTTELHPRG
jgi:nucleoside-diphosphate kinase